MQSSKPPGPPDIKGYTSATGIATGGSTVHGVSTPAETTNFTSTADPPKQRTQRGRKPAGSTLELISGKRRMKGYPLSESDMRDLAKTGLIAAACFSIASGLFGFIVSLAKDLAFAQNVPAHTLGFWNGVWWCAAVAAVVMAVLGVLQVLDGRTRLKVIMEQTTHDE